MKNTTTKLGYVVAVFAATVLLMLASLDACESSAAAATQAEPTTSQAATPSMPEEVRRAIAKGLEDEAHPDTGAVRSMSGKPGIFGIPGAPAPSYLLGFLWAIWVGWIFSTVGAFGGIMAGVGHITIFGLGDYAKGFGNDHPLNKLLTDSIRVSNQWLVGLSAAISSTNYYRMKRLVLPIGLSPAVGSVAGAFLIPRLTAGKVNLKDYIGIFGLIVLVLGGYLFYKTTERGQAKHNEAKAAAEAFEKQSKSGGAQGSVDGVEVIEGSILFMLLALGLTLAGALWGNLAGALFAGAQYVAYGLVIAGLLVMFARPKKVVRFRFLGVEFSFKAYLPAVGGFFIAGLASFLGIGGGFLLVPFLTSVAGLPMFLVAGTSALAVLVSMVVSIFTYMVGKGVLVPWGLIGAEVLGIFIGSMIGPRTQKYIPDIWLRRLFVVLAVYVGLRYTTKGLLGFSLLPPF